MPSIEQAVADWIIAEYNFRYGRRAYQKDQTDAIIEAENNLRRALTKKGGLPKAYLQIITGRTTSPVNTNLREEING